jgi:hypothetical protein
MSAEVPVIIVLIAIPTFFILGWILKRFIKNKQTRNWTLIAGTVIIAPLLYLVFVLAFFSYLSIKPQHEFNKEKWLADKHSRFEMRDYIIESKILIGKSKSEIIDLIGKPESKDTTELWKYYLGMSEAGFGVQINYLEITFENRKVSDVKLIEIID